ncbi:YbaN family protein [Paracoccus aminophilus]|uniref:DUF454 domain-containing protein n=1 Tax=Paracoccus aminophilus JCM 7686 TaxID=1367847 RepID=S5XJ38_PARAH|nr:YbaN family protein [Paracoccus aminophilus]AGT07194.1 hypothetical protein JCM7686_0083 [Paracoccus aminophilus JCM 7686]
MRIVYLGMGWLGVILGAIGALLPVIPTVPFLIVAVWAFSRSSPELRDRILNHPTLGPPIRAWRDDGTIKRRVKYFATAAMIMGLGWSIFLDLPLYVIIPQGLICTAIALFIVTRPEPAAKP